MRTTLVGASALALTLGGCKFDNRPLLARGEPPPAAPALGPLDPTYGQVTPAAYLPPDQAYVYPRRAYAMSRLVHQRPPSYAFGYGDEQPWVWDAPDEGLMFAEPVDVGWRYYYYEPGEAYPYFVQDADYGYAYGGNGVLLALFDAAGVLIAADRYHDYAPRASRYWTRACDLNRVYWRSPRYPVQETAWRERGPRLMSSQDRWFRGVSAQPAWIQAQRHDNGRRLGWDKGHGPPDRGARFARAAPPALAPQARPAIHAERAPPPREAHAWKQARQEMRPQAASGPRERRDAHRGPAFARAAEGRARPAFAHGPGPAQPRPDHARGGPHGGGQAFARAAQDHARPAAWHGPAPSERQPGRPQGAPHASSRGDHNSNKGGRGHDKADHRPGT